ncbi:MAG: hypothetical protein LQ346_002753 [Caloplaca aetnensis]|nr:MAG: hypothetical protein LQ346_002753 [Caloplaca aetnensis]
MKFIITESGAMHIDHPPIVQWTEPVLPGEEVAAEQSRTTQVLSSLLSAAITGTGKASKFGFTTTRAVTAPLLLSVCPPISLSKASTNTSQEPLHSHLPPRVSDGIHKLYNWLGYRGTGPSETHLQTISRQGEELLEMAETLLALDEHDKDLATSVASLTGQLGKLQLDHEALAQHTVVVEGQYERLGEELEEKNKEMERIETFYMSNQSHYDDDTEHMQKKMKKAQDQLAETNDDLRLTNTINKDLKRKIRRQDERHAKDVSKLKAIEKRAKELEAQGAKDRQQRIADAKKIEKLEREAADHEKKVEEHKRDAADYEKDAEDIGAALADEVSAKEKVIEELAVAEAKLVEEVSAKEELMQELAMIREEVAELEKWEEVGLADRITDGSTDQGTQTEGPTSEEADETVLEIVKELDGATPKAKPTYADAGTQTDASVNDEDGLRAKIIELETEIQQLWGKETSVDLIIAKADSLDVENRELRSSMAHLKARCNELNDSIAALQADKTELDKSLASAQTDVKTLTATKETLEAKLVEIEGARSAAEQSRDAALEELLTCKAKHHKDVEDARAQAQQIAEGEKKELREVAERRHEQVIEKLRAEAQEFEASKRREMEELRSQILLLNQQLAGLETERDNAHHAASSDKQRATQLEEQIGRLEAANEKRDEEIRGLKQEKLTAKQPPQLRPGKALRDQNNQLVAENEAAKRELKECQANLQMANMDRKIWLKNEEGKWLAEKKKLVVRIKELEAELHGSRNNNQSYLTSAQKAKERCVEMEKEVERLQREIESKQAQIAELDVKVSAADSKLAELKKEIKATELRLKKVVGALNERREAEGKNDEQPLGKRIIDDGAGEEDRSTKLQKTEPFAE